MMGAIESAVNVLASFQQNANLTLKANRWIGEYYAPGLAIAGIMLAAAAAGTASAVTGDPVNGGDPADDPGYSDSD